jgi:glycosyltransferase involved in cell wall biosynthesis
MNMKNAGSKVMDSIYVKDEKILKVAIVHYWLVGMRGGEKVVEEICKIFPQADIYTHVAIPEKLSPILKSHHINETFIARLPGARRHYQKYLPFMPYALEALDLSGYDIIITSESGPAKGIIADPDTLHICYCHSPMRYIWDQYEVYRKQAGRMVRWIMPLIAHRLRIWDAASSSRPDYIIANSNFVRRRISKSWGRDSVVVHPPVNLKLFSPVPKEDLESFYLYVGELVSYKRPDLVIDAFNSSGKLLVVIGDGAERDNLEAIANSNIIFIGRASFEELKYHYARCRALIFPGVEDFGIVPLEAMASGRPIVAYGKGGALETVLDGVTGTFFYEPTAVALEDAIRRLEEHVLPTLDADAMAKHVSGFSQQIFQDRIRDLVKKYYIEFHNRRYH